MRSPRSLRGRLVLGAVAVGLAFAVVFGAVATLRLHQVEDAAIDTALRTRLDLMRDEVRPDGSLRPDRGSPQTDLVQVLGPDGQVLTSGPALAGVPPLVTLDAVRAHGSSGARSNHSLQHPDIDLAALGVPLRLSGTGTTSSAGTGALVVAVDAEGFTAARADLLRLLLIGLLAVVLAIAVLSWALAGRALRSVTMLTEEAEGIRSGDLADGLPVPADDAELARLVGALNRMLARLDEGHARELAFAADAGHRLRTPVATLRAEAELALREPDPAEHLAALRRIVHDADQLTLIVDRMLARNRARTITAEPVRSALESAASRWARQAALLGVTFSAHLPANLTDEVTCPELTDVVEPIVDNALRHTPRGRQVELAVDLDQGAARMAVDVMNPGPGIPSELVPQIFDAWVSGRDASIAGGLGLWLARETARDTGGEVTLLDPSPGRTTFRVVLPCGPTPVE